MGTGHWEGPAGEAASAKARGAHRLHVYVSPHFDDVALSAGGTVLRQRACGERVLIVSVFTARPPDSLTEFAESQHEVWGDSKDPWSQREAEERAAMASLGASYVWLGYPDAIYRGQQYLSDDDLFGPIKAGDDLLRAALVDDLARLWHQYPGARLYLPLAVGNHVDHQLCCAAHSSAKLAEAPIAFYEDLPYSLSSGAVVARIDRLGASVRPVTVELGGVVEEKVKVVGLYESQVAWIFRHFGSAGDALRRYAASLSAEGGHAERLWLRQGGVAQ